MLFPDPRFGVFSSVVVQSDDLDPQELQNALDLWNGCGQSQSGFPTLTTEPPDAGSYYTITIEVHDLNSAGDGHCAEFNPGSPNTLMIFRSTERPDHVTVPCGDISQTAAHEIGHWFGLSDAPLSTTCQNFIMSEITGSNLTSRAVQPDECAQVDEKWSMDNERSGPNPPAEGCLPADPTGHLPGRCERVPELCRPGDPFPWWNIHETRPECGFGLVPGPEETEQVVRTCEFPTKRAVVYRDLVTTPGPVTTLTVPAPGGYVRGVVQIDGWMREDAAGVTGTLGFWLDQQHVYPIGVVYGEADAAACAGSSDPRCPYVGFSASLDTAAFADGPHTLEMMGAEAVADWPSPAYGKSTFTIDNTRPTVSITAPAAGASVAGTVQVAASASDVYGLSSLSFYVDGVYQASDNTAPYSFSVNTTSWADGAHTLRVRAWDKAGNNRDSSITVTFANDLQTPQVSLTKPAAGALVRASVTVEALASDDQGVSRVDFFLDGALLATDTTSPYRLTWNTTASVDGPHTLTAKAFDATGKVGVSPAVGVTVDNSVPIRYVDSPSHYQSVSGTTVLISGWAIDASRVVSRTFQIDGQALTLIGALQTVSRATVCSAHPEVADPNCPNVGWRGYFDSTRYPNGSHTLTATFVDAAGNPSTFSQTFVITNSQTATFYPVADATAWQALPTYNSGTQTLLAVRSPNDGQGAYAFLKFQVGGVEGQVTSARLKVRTSSPMSDLWLYWLVHSNWTESNLTWNYFPSPGGDLEHFYNLAGQTWYSFDVSGYVYGNGIYSLGFANSNPTYSYLWSRESSDKPVLEVTYVP